MNEMVGSVYVYGVRNGYFFGTGQDRTYTYADISGSEWTFQMWTHNTDYWNTIYNNLMMNKSTSILSLFKPIRNETQSQLVGYASINIPFERISESLKSIQLSPQTDSFIVDTRGTIIFHDNREKLGDFVEIEEYLAYNQLENSIINHDRIIVCVRSAQDNMIYVQEIPRNELRLPLISLTRSAAILMMVSVIVFFTYATLVSKLLTAPINTLLYHMKSAQNGDFNHPIEEVRLDEFGQLYTGYNHMVHQVGRLIKDVYVQKILVRDLKVKTLQSQLSPHFLYNALDAIHWAARDEEMEEVCNMIHWLSDYFRKGLTSGREIVSVREASEIINSYLKLQESRYEDKIEVITYVDPLIEKMEVMKYLFQPIVENAFKHGLEKKSSRGHLYIGWESVGQDSFKFVVRDNGAGISEQKLKHLRASLYHVRYEDDLEESLALKNIQLLLRLFYNDTPLIIDSVKGKGTKVSFIITPERRNDHENLTYS